MDVRKIRRRRINLWKADPRCHWCGRRTVLRLGNYGQTKSDTATVDHLRSRMFGNRPNHMFGDPPNTVLACYACNHARNVKEQTTWYLKPFVWYRAKSFPRWVLRIMPFLRRWHNCTR